MLAVEIAAWTGYASFHNEGLDMRDDYENFADQHWTIGRWIEQHEHVWPDAGGIVTTPAQMDSIGQVVSGSGDWPGFIPWVSKVEDKQHFYENIGKYDWYISGWEDYDPSLPSLERRDTPMRDEYRQMRIDSNDKLKVANRFIYLSIATRVASIVQTVILVRQHAADDGVATLNNHFQVTSRARGALGGEIALEYNFK